jgi:hypothetical protein
MENKLPATHYFIEDLILTASEVYFNLGYASCAFSFKPKPKQSLSK